MAFHLASPALLITELAANGLIAFASICVRAKVYEIGKLLAVLYANELNGYSSVRPTNPIA